MSRKRWDAIIDRVNDLPEIRGVEVGVWTGILSERLLRALPHLELWMVDRWLAPDEDDSYYKSDALTAKLPQTEYDAAYAAALHKTAKYADRRHVLVMESEPAAQALRQQFDFVFIDADHSYEGVRRDIGIWAGHVRCGGWLCGHDYGHPEQGEVKRAVDEWAEMTGYEIETDANNTWFVRMT